MSDETQNPTPPNTDPAPDPGAIPPQGAEEDIPDWLKRIRERRAAERGRTAQAPADSSPANVGPPTNAGPPPASDAAGSAEVPPEPEIFEHVPQPDTLPDWLRVASEDNASTDVEASDHADVPDHADVSDHAGVPTDVGVPVDTGVPEVPIPAPPMTPDTGPIAAPPAPSASEPAIDPNAEAPDWLKAAVAAKTATPAQEAASATPQRGVPVHAPETQADPSDSPDEPGANQKNDAATRAAIRAARAQRRHDRRVQARRNSPLTNTLQSLIVTVVAAAMIATIFTFWTPASFLSDETREGLRPAYATLSAQSPPTPIPTPVWMRQIGIVSGHWGPYPGTGRDDPGAVCPDGLTESEINRSVAQLVVQQLSGRGYDVDLLDEWDPRLDGYQASALLSLHADSCFEFDQPGATGFKVAPPASRTSARTDDLRLQDCLVRKYGEITGMPLHPSLTRDMTEYHSFREISPVTPANIIELGFMFEDRDLLENRPDLLAEGIVAGLLCFLENAPPTPLPELTPWPTLEATPTPLATPGVS